MESALAVRAYHSDLAASLINGKSPALQQAYAFGIKAERIRALAEEHLNKGADEVAAAARAEDEVKVEAIAQLGFGVKVKSADGSTASKAPSVDLFAKFEELRKAKPG